MSSPTESAARVLVIDDHPLFRKGVADLLSLEPQLCLIGEAADGPLGVRLAAESHPDLVLLDLNMSGWDGIETLRRLRALPESEMRILMLTVSDQEADVVAALRAGADGYLLKDMEPELILEQLREALQGRFAISPRLTELLARALRRQPGPTPVEQAGLTPRESQVLALIAQGFSNKLIARELDLAVGTVKVHVKNLLRKLGLHSRVEAAVWCSKSGSQGVSR